jgi:hypothetical protein
VKVFVLMSYCAGVCVDELLCMFVLVSYCAGVCVELLCRCLCW